VGKMGIHEGKKREGFAWHLNCVMEAAGGRTKNVPERGLFTAFYEKLGSGTWNYCATETKTIEEERKSV